MPYRNNCIICYPKLWIPWITKLGEFKSIKYQTDVARLKAQLDALGSQDPSHLLTYIWNIWSKEDRS